MTIPAAPMTDAPPPATPWLLWQLVDSAFPIGSFAHSGGVEAAYQHGRIPSPAALFAFTQTSLRQSLNGSLPFTLAAFDDTHPLQDLHDHLDSTLSNHVANRASRVQAHALLASAEKIFRLPQLTTYRREVLAASSSIHLPIIFGLLARSLFLPRADFIRLQLLLTARAVLSAAVRLGAVGPIQAQQLQTDLTPTLDALATRAQTLTLEDAAQTAPLLELLQATQDRLYSRLFQS